MAKQPTKTTAAKAVAAPAERAEKANVSMALGMQNYKLMLVGFVIIVIGFVLMSGGKSPDPKVFNGEELYSFRRITLAPIVVALGFAFELYAIMKRSKKEAK
jgi:predicted ABC-type sugar transport system permease subunit